MLNIRTCYNPGPNQLGGGEPLHRCLFIFALVALGSSQEPRVGTSANKTNSSQARDDQMKSGVLAIASDEAGTLIIDGAEGPAITPSQVVTVKLVAGEHFIELRSAKGEKAWEKIIVVPAAAQVAERIETHREVPSLVGRPLTQDGSTGAKDVLVGSTQQSLERPEWLDSTVVAFRRM